MKILLSACRNPHFPTITEYIESAVRKLGHDLVSFDDRDFLLPGRIRIAMPVLHGAEIKRINGKLIRAAREAKPDILLVAGGERLLPAALVEIKKAGIKTVLWTIDQLRIPDSRLEIAPYFDFVFCGGTEMKESLENKPIENGPYWLPFGCDPDVHKPASLTAAQHSLYECDVAFVGSLHRDLYPFRIKTLEAISDFRLGIWGPGAGRIAKSSPARKYVRGEDTSADVWTKIYSAAKIVLCLHYRVPGNTIPCCQASPRVYEALACKSFLLVDNQKDVCALFQDGRHLAIFNDTDDCREKINYYLSHAAERLKIAEQGYRETVDKHTYAHRIKQLLAVIGLKQQRTNEENKSSADC